MSSDTFTSVDDADDVPAAVAAALPTWHSYFPFGGRPHSRRWPSTR